MDTFPAKTKLSAMVCFLSPRGGGQQNFTFISTRPAFFLICPCLLGGSGGPNLTPWPFKGFFLGLHASFPRTLKKRNDRLAPHLRFNLSCTSSDSQPFLLQQLRTSNESWPSHTGTTKENFLGAFHSLVLRKLCDFYMAALPIVAAALARLLETHFTLAWALCTCSLSLSPWRA